MPKSSKKSDVTGRPVARGWLARITDGAVVATYEFQYNPTEVAYEHTVNYSLSSAAGSPLPTAYFGSIQGQSVSFSLLLDATEGYSSREKGVLAQKAELISLVSPDLDRFSRSLGQFVSPPEVLFGMGPESVKVIVPKISFRDVRFNRELEPTRCYADIQLQAIYTSAEEYAFYLAKLARMRSMVVIGKTEPTMGISDNPYVTPGVA